MLMFPNTKERFKIFLLKLGIKVPSSFLFDKK